MKEASVFSKCCEKDAPAAERQRRRIGIASFTKRGTLLADRLAAAFGQEYEISRYETGLKDWCGALFAEGAAGIVFVGACGIAVRTIAPFLKSKTTDPAVVVLDEAGQFAISLLSGHLGGANRLAQLAASAAGAVPVITTATDVNHRLAVDVFAADQNLVIGSMQAAKLTAAAILRGETVGLYCEGRIEGPVPEELTLIPSPLAVQELPDCMIWIAPQLPPAFSKGAASGARPVRRPKVLLHLQPKCYVLGIGCRRGKTKEEIEALVLPVLEEAGIPESLLAGAASIDLKKEEQGLREFCGARGLPFVVYSAGELLAVPGSLSASAFVRETAGVDNVCERAALKLAGAGGKLMIKKQARGGVTVAAAVRDWSVCFEK